MKQFEVGHLYGTNDMAVPPVRVIKKTAKMIKVRDYNGVEFRMKIKEWNGNELATDNSVPASWRDCYTYDTAEERSEDWEETMPYGYNRY